MVTRHVGNRCIREKRVLRERKHHGTGPPGNRGVECTAYVLRDALNAVDLRHPLRHLAVHAPVVDFLERFALDEFVRHLADEHHHRRRILEACVRRSRRSSLPGARYEQHARLAGELAGLSHVRRTAFLAADDETEPILQVVQAVQDGK